MRGRESWRTRNMRPDASGSDKCVCAHRYDSHDVTYPGGQYCEACRQSRRQDWHHSITLGGLS